MTQIQATSRPSGLTRRAFTLIELLVVIAIIAMLAAILFPVFGRARENARRTSCQSNLKQWGVSMMQYNADYDELYPPTWNGSTAETSSNARPWAFIMQPYIKNVQIMQCPSATNDVTGTITALRGWRDQLGLTVLPLSYAYNYYVGGEPANSTGSQFGVKKVAQMRVPSETILLADAGSVPPWSTEGGTGGGASPELWNFANIGEGSTGNGGISYPNRRYTAWILVHPGSTKFDAALPNWGTLTSRHLSTTNVLWADGHVKAQRLGAIADLSASADYTVPPTSCFNPARGCPGISG